MSRSLTRFLWFVSPIQQERTAEFDPQAKHLIAVKYALNGNPRSYKGIKAAPSSTPDGFEGGSTSWDGHFSIVSQPQPEHSELEAAVRSPTPGTAPKLVPVQPSCLGEITAAGEALPVYDPFIQFRSINPKGSKVIRAAPEPHVAAVPPVLGSEPGYELEELEEGEIAEEGKKQEELGGEPAEEEDSVVVVGGSDVGVMEDLEGREEGGREVV